MDPNPQKMPLHLSAALALVARVLTFRFDCEYTLRESAE